MKLLPILFLVVWALLARAARKSRQAGRPSGGAPADVVGSEQANMGQAERLRRVREQAVDRRAAAAREADDRESVRREDQKAIPASWMLPKAVPKSHAQTSVAPPVARPSAAVAVAPAGAAWADLTPISLGVPEPTVRTDWAALMRQSGSMRQAVILSEILRRPAG